MKLIRWNPQGEAPARVWSETTGLFDRLFEDFLGDRHFLPSFLHDRTGVAVPAVDILEKDGNLVLRAELPGMNEKDIELKLEGNVLTLKGERRLEEKEDRQNYHRVESFYGTFTRSFTLPETIQADKIAADYKNGILTVTLPQKPEAKARSIQIKSN